MLILMILLLVTVDLVKTPCFSSYNIFFAFLRNSIGAIPRVNVGFQMYSNFAFFKNSFVTVIDPHNIFDHT